MLKKFSIKRALRVTSLVLTTAILTGCATTTGIVGIDDLCNRENPDEGLIRPFYWHSQDTDDTIRQGKDRNAEYEAVCVKRGSLFQWNFNRS